MTTEINEKLDSVLKGVKDVQDIASRNKDRIDALDQEQIKKIADDSAKTLDEVNTLKNKQDELIKATENLEKASMRMVSGDDAEKAKKEMKTSYIHYLKKGGNLDDALNITNCREIATKNIYAKNDFDFENEVKLLQVQSNPDGGYFVRAEMADKMIERIYETSPMRQVADIVTISGESIEFMIDDQEADAGWVGEVDARTDTSTPTIGMATIYAHELYAQPTATQKMLDDAGFDIEAWLAKKLSSRFSRLENTSFVSGDGSKKPKGFLSYAAWAAAGVYERGKLEQVVSGSASALTADGIKNLQTALIEDYQGNAVFIMNRATFGIISILKDGAAGNERYLLDPNSFKTGDTKILLGKPVIFASDMPVVASDSLSIAYGDFREGYTIVDRMGIRILRDPYTSKPKVRFYTTKRVGGDVTNYQSIKIHKVST